MFDMTGIVGRQYAVVDMKWARCEKRTIIAYGRPETQIIMNIRAACIKVLGIRDICRFQGYVILVVLLPGICYTVINFKDFDFFFKKKK